MRWAYEQPGAGVRQVPLRRRATSIALAVAAHLLVALLLLRLAPPPTEPPQAQVESRFELLPDRGAAPQPSARRTERVTRQAQKAASAAQPAATPPVVPPVVPPVPVPLPTPAPENMGMMLETFDLAKVPRRPGEGRVAAAGEADGDSGSAGDSIAAYGPGAGPGGQRLYNADWYREPTDAQLSFYLKRGAPAGSWAEIACRTAEQYHVEDCRALGESPPGSGLARSIREAAWQFLVIPPRVGGKRLIGAWVRIRIDFTQRGVK